MASCMCKVMVSLKAGSSMIVGNPRSPISFSSFVIQKRNKTSYFVKSSSLDPPDVPRLAETARISLTPQEIQEFGPKIQQVVEWFGQLQAVDLESIEPAIRSDIDSDNLREDIPQTFENRDGIVAAIPSYEEPYIKVPKVLKKE